MKAIRRPRRCACRLLGAVALATRSLLALAGPDPASATVLTFDPVGKNFEDVNQAYGDRVAAAAQDGFFYGADGGFTPNVVVDYGPLPLGAPSLWTTGYGDLVNCLFDDHDGHGLLEVKLSADPGWKVALHSFDTAAWRPIDPIEAIRVTNGAGDVLFEQADVAIPTTGRLAFTFDPPLVGRWLTLAIDSSNLGSNSDNVAIDDVLITQEESPLPVEATSWGKVKAGYR